MQCMHANHHRTYILFQKYLTWTLGLGIYCHINETDGKRQLIEHLERLVYFQTCVAVE